MKLGRWIVGALGFVTLGPLGGLLGFFMGSLFEQAQEPDSEPVGHRNGFLFSLLVMASYIIRADGKIMHSEMEFVRRFLRNTFGVNAEQEGNEILLGLFEQRKRMDLENPYAFKNKIHECCEQIRRNLGYEERLQLLHFLADIAKSDGNVCREEIEALQEIASAMGLSQQEVDSMLSLSGDSLEDAYKVLEIDPSATDAEVKAAFRKLVLKHHPDRVAELGDDVKAAAEKKIKQINEAKERIFAARGMK